MRVSLIKNNDMSDLVLPTRVVGNYWITEFDNNNNEKNLISIEACPEGWKLVSNSDYAYTENQVVKPSVILKEYNFYIIKNQISDTYLILYCSPTYDSTYNYYDITGSSEITIGSSQSCDICYQNPNLNENHAKLVMKNRKFSIIDNDSKRGVYVNNKRIVGSKNLENGDVIFLMGLKIIVSAMDEQFYLIINNPSNLMHTNFSVSSNPNINKNETFTEPEDELDFELYKQEDYFNKKPRFTQVIEELKLKIDPPPNKEEEKESSMLLTVGPMLTMSMTSIVMGYSAVNNMANGSSLSSVLPTLVMCIAMVSSIVIWPTVTKKYEKKRRIEKEKERQEKYSKYIEEKRKMIESSIKTQTSTLLHKYPASSECENIILNKLTRLFERRRTDEDFTSVNLGYGTQPMKIDIQYPEDHFSMVEDNLKEMLSFIGNEPKNLTSSPIAFNFVDSRFLAILGEKNIRSSYMSQLFLQLMAFHSYEDLKIVVLTNKDNESNWEYMKVLPHCLSDDKQSRYFATDNNEYKEICYQLDRIFNARKEATREGREFSGIPYYIIMTDSLNSVRNFDVIKHILESKENLGFSIVILDNKVTNIPNQCENFVQLDKTKSQFYKTLANNHPIDLDIDFVTQFKMYECAEMLANVPIKIDNEDEGKLPSKLGFLEMYDVGKVEQLNSLNLWSKNNPILSLQAPVGFGKSGEKISIDLHEKYHGPHGLIAGMTGSGKSEFIITYILSMALNYHPYEVQFILIDYKGGGLAGAFENNVTGIKLPHLVGTITNLDANEIKRSLASVESELKRRQKAFNKAREISGESTVDIYKYQKMYRNGLVDEPVSHLFIISDEFAELKNQQPEFMEQLISTARIGRSLGVHLILATQKPSGVVDPQIWSNTRFRVCLRVQEKSDSQEVIKCPDAALLKQTGRFYFQVGYNEIFTLGQAAWAGGKYIPQEKIKKNIDSSLEFIDNIGYVIKTVESKKEVETVASQGEELNNIVKYLYDIAKTEKISCRPLWLDKIPAMIYVDNLIKKYKYQKEDFIINPIIGEYDNPSEQAQHLLTMPISNKGNAVVYGVTGSGKENFITTMIYSSMLYHTAKEVNYYIIDFGSEALRSFSKSPLVGDILYSDDEDKIKNLYKMLLDTIEKRKKLFADYNGDYYNYCKNSGNTVPNIVVIINNYESYVETYPDFEDDLIVLSRDGSKYGVYFVMALTTPNGMRYKIKQNFNQEFVLQQNNDDDYVAILGNIQKNYPSSIYGRGIIKTDKVYEFQTAHIADSDKIQTTIKELCEYMAKESSDRAIKVPVLPEIVDYNSIASVYKELPGYAVGISKNSLDVTEFDFSKNNINLVTSNDMSLEYKFLTPFINQILAKGTHKLAIINADDFVLDEKYSKYLYYYQQNLDQAFEMLKAKVVDAQEKYKNNNYDKSIFASEKPTLCIIIGIENFKNRISDENRMNFGEIFDKAKDLGIINYIIFDTIDQIKTIEYEQWFKNNTSTNDGIWIGSGISDQFTLKVSQRIPEMQEEVEENFCFVLNRGRATVVKFVEEFKINI